MRSRCVIVQPPQVKRWVTTPARVAEFERELVNAVKQAPEARRGHQDWRPLPLVYSQAHLPADDWRC